MEEFNVMEEIQLLYNDIKVTEYEYTDQKIQTQLEILRQISRMQDNTGLTMDIRAEMIALYKQIDDTELTSATYGNSAKLEILRYLGES